MTEVTKPSSHLAVVAAVSMAIVVAAAGVAFNQRSSAAHWRSIARDRTRAATAVISGLRHGLAHQQTQIASLQARLDVSAAATAQSGDKHEELTVLARAARRASADLAACQSPSRLDSGGCVSAQMEAQNVLAGVYGLTG